jgi:release factor glutamine methyltransferase
MTWAQLKQYLQTHTAQWYSDSEQTIVARRLVEHLSGQSFLVWKTLDNATLPDDDLLPLLNELSLGKPLQYVVGNEYFAGMLLQVNEAVLIPRPETAELVQWILAKEDASFPHRVIDIGTGSACIALALKKNNFNWQVVGVDKSEAALSVAQNNAKRIALDVRFMPADVLDESVTFDAYTLWVSNPPYIPMEEKADMSAQVYAYEPSMALFVTNNDPLQFYKAIEARWLQFAAPQAPLYFELSSQAEQIIHYFSAKQQYLIEHKNDMYGLTRMLRIQQV